MFSSKFKLYLKVSKKKLKYILSNLFLHIFFNLANYETFEKKNRYFLNIYVQKKKSPKNLDFFHAVKMNKNIQTIIKVILAMFLFLD